MNYKLELTPADIELIGTLLDEQPYKIVARLAQRMQTQIDAQNAPVPDVLEAVMTPSAD